MSSYKKNAESNRNALFGGAGGGSKDKKKSSRPTTVSNPTPNITAPITSRGYASNQKKKISKGSMMSPEAKAAKIKEAEDYKAKANKAMQKSFFNRPDPVSASTFFKRAADCYQAVGDERLERLYRLESGGCNLQVGAWASAASDYTRAAELVLDASDEMPDVKQRRRDASSYHKKAAIAWKEMGEKAKAAGSEVQAAIALNFGEEGTMLSKDALAGMEEAVEAHVPDVFNPYARYRQTGNSCFIDPDSDETTEKTSEATLAVAREHVVTRSYAHEPLQDLVYLLIGFGEYSSALYACGAASYLLEQDNISTLTLGRSYVTETILTLAMGDPIGAEQAFLQRHVQKTSYLQSRECKLAEDLFRAIKTRDPDALEEARSPSGSNRGGLANLPHESLRTLVAQLRVSGVAKKGVGSTTIAASSSDKEAEPAKPPPSLQELASKKTGYEQEAQEGAKLDGNALSAELDDLDFGGDDSEDKSDGLLSGSDSDDDMDLR